MNAIDLCELPTHWRALVIAAVLLVERWLGRTNVVKSASILDLLENMLLACAFRPLKAVFTRGPIVEKEIGKFEKSVGGDGAVASGKLLLSSGNLVARVEVTYPLAKVMGPVNDIVDKVAEKIEAAIPGDWDKALLEPIVAEAKQEILKLLSE